MFLRSCVLLVFILTITGNLFGQHFEFNATNMNQSVMILAATFNDNALVNGDEIGVFTEEGVCAGAAVVEMGFPIGLAAWAGDDQNDVPGFAGGESMSFRLWIDDEESEHEANIEIVQGNINFNPNTMVVLRLEASADPQINVEQILIEFGAVPINQAAESNFTIANLGQGELLIENIEVDGECFSVEFDGEISIDPEEEVVFTVVFCPENYGVFESEITITSNDPVNQEFFISLTGCCLKALSTVLVEGWGMVSINIVPLSEMFVDGEARGPDVVLMTERLRIDDDQHHLILIKDELGQFYSPEFGFNNIPFWNLTEGYQIQMDEDIEVSWEGLPVPADFDVPLDWGWNLIAYCPDYELNADSPDFYALSPIIDHVIMAKDGFGMFLNPAFHFSNMHPWREGQGYQVQVDEEIVLNYPEQMEEEDAAEVLAKDVLQVIRTSENMSLLINSLPASIDLNSIIAAFDSDGNCIGTGTIDGEGRCGMAIWGDEPSTDAKEGLLEGESFTLKIMDDSKNSLSVAEVTRILNGDGLIYSLNGFSVVDISLRPEAVQNYFLSEGYPNPFNASTRLQYGVADAGMVNITVYDAAGRMVSVLKDGFVKTGVHSVQWQAGNIANGVYIIRMNIEGFETSNKVVLVK